MIEINPVETVIAYLKAKPGLVALVGDRIDTKHHYGSEWDRSTDASVVVTLGSGVPDLYAPVQTMEVEFVIYAPTQYDAVQVWRELVDVSRSAGRERVATTDGEALVYDFVQGSTPRLLYDDEVQMDLCLCYFVARVGENAI